MCWCFSTITYCTCHLRLCPVFWFGLHLSSSVNNIFFINSSLSSLSLLCHLQPKWTPSSGLLTTRVTGPYSCRVVSAAFIVRWNYWAGERQSNISIRVAQYSTALLLPELHCLQTITIKKTRDLISTFMFSDILGRVEEVMEDLICVCFPLCPQRSFPSIIARGCHHENVWSHGGGTDYFLKFEALYCVTVPHSSNRDEHRLDYVSRQQPRV